MNVLRFFTLLTVSCHLKRNGLDLDIEFQARMSTKERKFAFALQKNNMAAVDLGMTESEQLDEFKAKAK